MKSSPMLVLGLVFALALVSRSSAQLVDFDYYYFVVQWPGSYCDLQKACCYPLTGKPAANFSIHGLWPEFLDGTWPQDCDTSQTFDLEQVRDLVPELNKYWGTLTCPSSDSTKFWKHEWEKHGTCTGLTQHEFFSKTLALMKSINLGAALEKANIVPSDTATYNVTQVQSALACAIEEHTPGVECNIAKSGNNQLYQVYVCVDKDGTTLIPCPAYPNGRCNATVYWPTF
ncbi:ribonuclease T2 [Marchantia polymorpha subsp. ruderalis]|uniref:Uncharacterized protein n=2 Tax=Marchantia polymorpha TaxID=3197 RepID=A0A176WKZ1_MARPO|nr:hypothetical protein AXG93_1193s1170 [Marchantia polymorpha subsp. ruderalis]PTQ45347.1 hypothetical protein MARPO_0015s0142 [Marchantia polymorpha]BBN01580.1 hypothetical protein Mp_2g08570 [Marchantia polymorpha subsp. ruderalis]|eukprot:PTQ45347.1 hypothetical protein MARPO_0015s0142 [Marchantia polymorpha]